MRKIPWKKKRSLPQRLVYTHLAKAGGNSVTAFLNSIAGEFALSVLGVSGASSVNACHERLGRMISRHRLPKEEFKIVLGHLPFSVSRRLFPSAFFTTTLRKPEWQHISNYCSQPFNGGKPDFGMSDYIAMVDAHPYAEWAIDNYQTRMLCDAPRFGEPVEESMLESAKRNLKAYYPLVGFVEHIGDYFQALGALYGFSSAEPAVSPRNVTGNYKPYVEPHHLEHIRQRNALDVSLYQWAIDELFPRPSPAAMAMPEERGASYVTAWISCR